MIMNTMHIDEGSEGEAQGDWDSDEYSMVKNITP
jgi:hypothetical protein